MSSLILAIALAGAIATACHIASIANAAVRCRASGQRLAPPFDAPAVSIVRPVCGLDNFADETLSSTFALDYPDYEIIFCVAAENDAAIPLLRKLIAAHPHVRARLIVGNERVNANPKLNNCLKGWRAASHDWIAIVDSNVLMPADTIHRLMARWRGRTGLVSSPAVGSRPQGFWAELECAFLNTYAARWQLAADSAGFGFAQGKTMLWRRADLERAGGISALAAELAEDAAATKIVREAGRRVRLPDAPFEQPLGRRTAAEVWNRQLRWARLRRASFVLCFMPELFTGALLPLIAVAAIAAMKGVSVVASVGAFAALWYGCEVALIVAAGWHLPAFYPFYALLRDLLLPALFVGAWTGSDFVWRGNEMSVAEDGVAV
jgi:ceramide glucosyltransferase